MQRYVAPALFVFWILHVGSTSWSGGGGPFKSLSACIAEGQKDVAAAKAREEQEYADARAHGYKEWATQEDFDVGWECAPSDHLSSTYGGAWKDKGEPRPYGGLDPAERKGDGAGR
jgi:hypothetical protein